MIKKSRLRWFRHVEHKDNTNWVKYCMTLEVEGIKTEMIPKEDLLECINDDVENLGLLRKDLQFMNRWRRRIKGATG